MDSLNALADLDAIKVYLQTKGTAFLLNLVTALLLFFVGRLVARLLAKGISRMLERSGTDTTLVRFLNNLVYAVLLLLVVVMSLERVGVSTTSFVAMLGAAGLAVGLALQSSLSNFAAGVMIILLRHFRVGDRIEAAGQAGVVQDIQIFHSVLRNDDGVKLIVPNGAIVGGTIKVHPKAQPEVVAQSA